MLLAECKQGDRGRVSGFFSAVHQKSFYEMRGIMAGAPFFVLQKYGSALVVRFGGQVYGISLRVAMEIRVTV